MVKKLFLLLIRFYQVAISPHLGKNCRFVPTCSQYAMIAITRFGVIKGTYLALLDSYTSFLFSSIVSNRLCGFFF